MLKIRSVLIIVFVFLMVANAAAQNKKAVPAKTTAPAAVVMERGLALYNNLCLTCHQADGSGVPHLNPPLTPNEWVNGPKPRLIALLLNGSQGKVEIDGDTWSNSMPAQSFLTDQQIADVLTYVRNSFGNKATVVSPAEVKAQRAQKQ